MVQTRVQGLLDARGHVAETLSREFQLHLPLVGRKGSGIGFVDDHRILVFPLLVIDDHRLFGTVDRFSRIVQHGVAMLVERIHLGIRAMVAQQTRADLDGSRLGGVGFHSFYAEHHFRDVRRYHSICDVQLHLFFLRTIYPEQPMGLIAEDTTQRQYYQQDDIFERYFHPSSF